MPKPPNPSGRPARSTWPAAHTAGRLRRRGAGTTGRPHQRRRILRPGTRHGTRPPDLVARKLAQAHNDAVTHKSAEIEIVHGACCPSTCEHVTCTVPACNLCFGDEVTPYIRHIVRNHHPTPGYEHHKCRRQYVMSCTLVEHNRHELIADVRTGKLSVDLAFARYAAKYCAPDGQRGYATLIVQAAASPILF